MKLLGPALAIVVLLACGGEDERAPFAPRLGSGSSTVHKPMREVLERGLDEDTLLRCDIRQRSCQTAIFDETAATRGSEGAPPPVRVISRDALAAQARAGAEQTTPSAALRTLTVLGLLAPEVGAAELAERNADAILAAYFHEQDRVIVIDHGEPLDTPEATLTLAHEFVHALQDREHDLTALMDTVTSTDQKEGLLGLIEGEAETYAALVVAGEVQASDDFWLELRKAVLRGAVASNAAFFAADLNFPYTFGAEFVAKTYLAAGEAGIAELYQTIPRSARQILAGAGAAAPEGGWVEDLEDAGAATVPDGFDPVFEDSFGAFILHVFLERLARAPASPTVRLPEASVAARLRGDRVVAYERAGALAAVWRLRFEPEVAPEDVIDEVIASGFPFELREAEGDVLLFAGEDEGTLAELAAGFRLAAP